MNQQPPLPTYDNLFEPTITALVALGGSGNVQEIYDKVCELEGYSEEQQSVLHKHKPQTAISYRLGKNLSENLRNTRECRAWRLVIN